MISPSCTCARCRAPLREHGTDGSTPRSNDPNKRSFCDKRLNQKDNFCPQILTFSNACSTKRVVWFPLCLEHFPTLLLHPPHTNDKMYVRRTQKVGLLPCSLYLSPPVQNLQLRRLHVPCEFIHRPFTIVIPARPRNPWHCHHKSCQSGLWFAFLLLPFHRAELHTQLQRQALSSLSTSVFLHFIAF